MCNIEIFSPAILENNRDVNVLVSAGWTFQIFNELKKYGYTKNLNCFHIDEFGSVYNMYKFDKLNLAMLSYSITQKCTLKCKHCASFMPYINKPENYSIEKIMEDIDNCFKLVDYINAFVLVGGDAMMHPQFNEIFELICQKYYKKKFNTLEIATNAIIMPTQQQIELFQKYDAFIRFTNYGEFVKTVQKIPQTIELLEKHNLRYDHVQFDHWLDIGYEQSQNNIKKENLVKFFNACDKRSCMSVSDNKMFFCSNALYAHNADFCNLDSADYFDISNIDNVNKRELMEFMLGYSEKGYYEYCKKCNGSFNVNNKKIPVGEQLARR